MPPLVTLAILSYNQESFIRGAVRAALAQTYSNLEIIISDDCSHDQTLEIATLVAQNNGEKRNVVVRRTTTNLGPFKHVIDVACIAHGELLVLGAADDVSKPERVSSLVKAWQETGAWGLHSNFDTIDSEGKTLSKNNFSQSLASPDLNLRHYFSETDGIGIVHGATSAYDVRLFQQIDTRSAPWILAEDGALSLLLNAMRKTVVHLQESLVEYRIHGAALTNTGEVDLRERSAIEAYVKRLAMYARSSKNRAQLLIDFARDNPDKIHRRLNCRFIYQDIRRQELRSSWCSRSLLEKLRLSPLTKADLTWLFPRLLGMPMYISIKILRDKMRRR